MPTDTERIDALIRLAGEGDCPALLNDDNGHWAVTSDGFQTMPRGEEPGDIETAFYVEAGDWFDDPRAAIDEYVRATDAEGD